MVEIEFTALAQKIVEQWRNENVKLNIGTTEDELLAFERRFVLTLPPDFRYFYSLVNGMTGSESDKYFFCLWSLEEIAAAITQKEPSFCAKVTQSSAACKIEIPFGDYLIDSIRYLLCREIPEAQFFVHTDFGERLADNFCHFLQRFLTEPEKIYLL